MNVLWRELVDSDRHRVGGHPVWSLLFPESVRRNHDQGVHIEPRALAASSIEVAK